MPERDSETSFDDCYNELWSEVVAFASNRVGRDDAADVAQEVFVVVDRRWADAPSDPYDLRLWVYGVARRTCANHLRSRNRFERLRAKLAGVERGRAVPSDQNPSASAIAREVLAMARLRSEDDKELLILMLEEWTVQQIAALLGLSVPATNSRIHRLRNHLRGQFPDLLSNDETPGRGVP